MTNPIIKASCHSDDHCVEVDFDAEPWFKHAADEDILQLAKCEWGGDYAADVVAEYMEQFNEDIKEMFTYIRLRQRKETIGFECYVDETSAKRWLYENRPKLWVQIRNEESS